MKSALRLNFLLPLLLALCILRLWLMPLPSSFWVDEMATVFVARYGASHPSLADVAPQAWKSIYYHLPRSAMTVFGDSEIACRVPSVLAMGLFLFLAGRLAARLIQPEAAWFAIFACLSLRGIDYAASDARPYGLGFCVLAAALLFLVRWLDSARWGDALLFVVFGALLWRVHLLFWPLYGVFAIYTVLRLTSGETRVGWFRAGVVFAALAIALAPVAVQALALYPEARAHVFAPFPSLREVAGSLKLPLVALVGGGAWLLNRLFHWKTGVRRASWSGGSLIFAWWLCQPLCLLAFSWLTGNNVFSPRYLSIALPGAALTATVIAASQIPPPYWKPLSIAAALGALLFAGQWRQTWPPHHNSDWRAAARTVNELASGRDTYVVCPSPFVEAIPPVWHPDYALPGFLYAHLAVYPIRGKPILFPFRDSPAAQKLAPALLPAGRFLIYGWEPQVHFWRDWFSRQPAFGSWRSRRMGPFGDVDVVVFEKTRDFSERPGNYPIYAAITSSQYRNRSIQCGIPCRIW